MVEHVRNVQIQLPIVISVHQQQSVRHVQIHIIQRIMEPVVHYVHQRSVRHVIQRVECVQRANQDII